MTALPPYLQLSRYHVYYCRRVVPRDLRPVLRRRELKRSLGRVSHDEALRHVRIFSYQTEYLFVYLRDKTKTYAHYGSLGMIVRGFEMRADGTFRFDELETDPEQPEAETRAFQDLLAAVQPHPAASNGDQPPAVHSESKPLSQLVNDYCDEKLREKAWTPKSEQENRAIFSLLLRILGENMDCAEFSAQKANTVKTMLKQLPAGINKGKAYRGRDLQAIVAESPKPMSNTTINKYLTRYSAPLTCAPTY